MSNSLLYFLALVCCLVPVVIALPRWIKRAGRGWQWSRQAMVDMLDLIPEPVIMTDAKTGQFLLVNARWETVAGRNMEDVIGKTSEELGYWDNEEERRELRSVLLQHKRLYAHAVTLTSLGGKRKNYEVSARLMEFEGETAMLYIFRDVTTEREALARLEAQVVEVIALQEQLKEQAIRDPLTGLHNRRYLDETLPREIQRAKREGVPLSLVIIDLDHFKRINDTYGHAVGDRVLIALGDVLRRSARESDLICRYGGEEFIVVLPGASADHAVSRADVWRMDLAQKSFELGESVLHVTLSAGVTSYPAGGEDASGLITLADRALYRAKDGGRDRVSYLDAH